MSLTQILLTHPAIRLRHDETGCTDNSDSYRSNCYRMENASLDDQPAVELQPVAVSAASLKGRALALSASKHLFRNPVPRFLHRICFQVASSSGMPAALFRCRVPSAKVKTGQVG